MFRQAFVLAALCLFSMPVAAQRDYLEDLVERARSQRLAERIEWINLLHYKPRLLLPGMESLADAPRFFNAPDGKTDPQAELKATLASFFSDLEETDTQQNPQCQFIARYQWLKRELQFDPARLPQRRCPRFEQWRASLNPQEVTLIFPAAYLNNPASMYGHTLLRIDAADQDERTRILAYAINYAANTDETSGLVFAVKGLFGGYPGQFSIAPYYIKVQEYNDLENRDIWEYRLTLTPDEIDRLLQHAWELGPIYFDYYFFDENCSYHLLALLEVARPSLKLTDQFRWWAIPSDTVRVVTDEPGLLKEAVFRPARATQIRHRLHYLDVTQRTLAKDLAEGKASTDDERFARLGPSAQAAVLELAYDYAAYLRVTGRRDATDVRQQSRALLLARSEIDAEYPLPPIVPPAVRPDQGHHTARIGVGAGRDDRRDFVELRLRPVYHDLLDPEPGYVRGAQIEFFDTRVRYYTEEESTRLESFYPLRIVSLSPRDDFFRNVSWRVDIGWKRLRLADGSRPLVFDGSFAPGFSWEIDATERRGLWYVILDGTLQVDGQLEDGYSIGLGPSLGALWDATPALRVNVAGRAQRFGGGEKRDLREARLDARYALGAHTALRLELAYTRDFDHDAARIGLFWMTYF